MTFTKASRMPVLAAALCLLLMGFAGASYGAVRYNVVPSPTEVINTGLSEVTGGINLIVQGPADNGTNNGNRTGTSTGGHAQIGIIYNSQGTYMPIDNNTATGIRIFFTAGFVSANPTIIKVENILVANKPSGQITLDLTPGATPTDNDFIRVEGVRCRIAGGSGAAQGTDLYASLQSINDPSANQFTPDAVRVAKSLPGLLVGVTSDNLLLCFPTLGKSIGAPVYAIKITEGFARAFVDLAVGSTGGTVAGNSSKDRVDSGGQPNVLVPGTPPAATTAQGLGLPTNSTQFTVQLDSIPPSVASVIWSDSSVYTMGANTSYLKLISSTTPGDGTAAAVYSYETTNQTDASDVNVETFTVQPLLKLASSSTYTGTVNAAVTLSPNFGSVTELPIKGSSYDLAQPRFLLVWESYADPSNENPTPGDASKPYAVIIRCNCFMLFTYVTAASGFDTGIAVANTSLDDAVFGTAGASKQTGAITFFFYDYQGGYKGLWKTTTDITYGQTFRGLISSMLPNITLAGAAAPLTQFSGYVIAKAEFQYCHAVSYISDAAFAVQAQGYAALIIPDPSIKFSITPKRQAADAGDITNLPAGEGLNN